LTQPPPHRLPPALAPLALELARGGARYS